jgi:uncharacterized protein (DUF736 family)
MLGNRWYMKTTKETTVGALWQKKSKKGLNYFLGVITLNGKQERIVVFNNNKKKSEKAPDFNIYRASFFGSKQTGNDQLPIDVREIAEQMKKEHPEFNNPDFFM